MTGPTNHINFGLNVGLYSPLWHHKKGKWRTINYNSALKTWISHGTTCFGLTRPLLGTCIYKNIEKIMYNTTIVVGKADSSLHHKNVW